MSNGSEKERERARKHTHTYIPYRIKINTCRYILDAQGTRTQTRPLDKGAQEL